MLTPQREPWVCPHCGMRVTGGETKHKCDPITLAARVEAQFGAWLDTPQGRFATYRARGGSDDRG